MRIVATVYLREVLGYFYSPIAYVLGSAFWAVQGFSFWALMRALSDPRQPAEVGAVLRQFFGGTLLHWLVVFSLLAMLSMRTIAEEKRDGMWESMLTTRAQASSILVAKWLALVSFYCLLWLPTLLLIYFFTMFLPPEQALDWGPVASAYLGIIAIGAALAAIGIAISSLTSSQVVAGIISLVVFLSWLMLGELGDVGATGHSSQWVFFVNLRLCLESFARGEVDLARLLSLAFVAVLALRAAASVIGQSKTERNRFRIACIALVVAGASASSLAGKHWTPGDWTAHS
ncbi:MAG: ABC transporter permease, partial [Kofleriaceae bacterium]|nr:ABC transporter permease [Kofleriaceae bacterium]